jgi:hypothetical protein
MNHLRKKIKTTTSAVLQTVTTTFSGSMDMNMQGHMVYEIAPLTTTIKPNTIGNSTCHINVINTAIFVVTVSHFNYLLCAVYKFS